MLLSLFVAVVDMSVTVVVLLSY